MLSEWLQTERIQEMNPRINQNAEHIAPLPAGYEDERGILAIIHAIIDDDEASGVPRKQCQAKRQSWKLLWPIFEQAEKTSLDDLGSPEGIGRFMNCLCIRKNAQSLGDVASTVDSRLSHLNWGLKAAGLEGEHLYRIKSQMKRVRSATGYDEHEAKPYTWEETIALFNALDEICEEPGNHRYKQGRFRFTDYTAGMARAATYLQASTATRISEIHSIRLSEISDRTFTYRVIKGSGFGKPRTVKMWPTAWKHVQSYIEARKAKGGKYLDDDRLFPTPVSQLGEYTRPAYELAGIKPHHKRYGGHRFRTLATSDAIEEGWADAHGIQAMLNHKNVDTHKHYASADAMKAKQTEALACLQGRMDDHMIVDPELMWDETLGDEYYQAMIQEEVKITPRKNVGPGRVHFNGVELRLGKVLGYFPDRQAVMFELGDSWATVRFDFTMTFPEQLIVADKNGFRTTKVLAPGFEPGSKAREAFMMGRYTTRAVWQARPHTSPI